MKKSTLLISLALITVSLTTFGFINWNDTIVEKSAENQIKDEKPQKKQSPTLSNHFITSIVKNVEPDFLYDVGSRFIATATKEQITQAKSIVDILPEEATQYLKDYKDIKISILSKNEEISEFGIDQALATNQIDVLKSIEYSTNFNITAYCKRDAHNNGTYSNYKLTYYMTVVPEKEAQFEGGKAALLNFLKKNSKNEIITTQKEKVKSGKVGFTVASDGKVSGVDLESTSGYPSVDKKMMQLIQETSGRWESAANSKGEKVAQRLYFSFGNMGC